MDFCSDTNYEILGNGKPVLFLHGWGSDISDFKAVANNVSNFYKTINIDFWGFGKSGQPSGVWGVSEYANEVLKLINNLQLKDVNLVGHSFGGRVAIKLCSSYPNLFKSLILSDSAGIRKKLSFKQQKQVKKFKKLKQEVLLGKKDKKVLDSFGSSDYKQLDDKMKAIFVKVVNEDLKEDAKQITIPTMIVWGKNDKETPVDMGKKFNKIIKNSRLVILNGGHYCHIENLEQYCDLCMKFWEEL